MTDSTKVRQAVAVSLAIACVFGCLVRGSPTKGQIPADSLLQSLRPAADVNDFAGILTPAERAALEERCKTLRQKTGAQLAVVTLKSLSGGQIDDFANRLFARWGIGEKGKDNGILLLVAMEDRKAKIEVGYGMEPILPDALAGRILDQQLFPAFKQKRYAKGLRDAVGQICEIVERGEPASAADRQGGGLPLRLRDKVMLALFLTLFVAVGTFIGGAGARTRQIPMILFGILFAGIPLLMGCFLAYAAGPLIHFPTALIMGWLGWRTGPGMQSARRTWGPNSPLNTWSWPDARGSSGGFSGWSSGGGGGFSSDWGGFGGGSSGGGGASGGW